MKELTQIRIGFFGTPSFALSFLEDLFSNKFEIAYIVTQPPKVSGRGRKIRLSPVHEWALNQRIQVFTPKIIHDDDFIEKVSTIKIDFNVVVAYGNILNNKIIKLPRYQSLNVHASALPRWRGAAPIQRAILNNDKKTGVSVIRVDEKLDSGPVILEKSINIQTNENFESLSKKIIKHGKEILKKSILSILKNEHKYKYQNSTGVTYAKKINKTEFRIIWNKSALNIDCQIRAFSPKPGAWTCFRNSESRIKILKACIIPEERVIDANNYSIGEITKTFLVKCSRDFLKIEIIQKEGKKPTTMKDFVNGNNITDFFFI